MSDHLSRRTWMQAAGAVALAPLGAAASASWPHVQGGSMPKICLGTQPELDGAGMRTLKQIGVDFVLMGGPRIPWDEADLRARMDRFKAAGLTICNMMISGFND